MEKWNIKIIELCIKYGLELINNKGDTISIICSKDPDDNAKKEIRDIIPSSLKIEYVNSLKLSTEFGMKVLLVNAGVSITDIQLIKKTLKISVNNPISSLEHAIEYLTNILRTDGFLDTWEIHGTDTYQRINLIEISHSEIKRDLVITEDEITDLRILLNTTSDVENFIKSLN